jgi:hypothetical protein
MAPGCSMSRAHTTHSGWSLRRRRTWWSALESSTASWTQGCTSSSPWCVRCGGVRAQCGTPRCGVARTHGVVQRASHVLRHTRGSPTNKHCNAKHALAPQTHTHTHTPTHIYTHTPRCATGGPHRIRAQPEGAGHPHQPPDGHHQGQRDHHHRRRAVRQGARRDAGGVCVCVFVCVFRAWLPQHARSCTRACQPDSNPATRHTPSGDAARLLHTPPAHRRGGRWSTP